MLTDRSLLFVPANCPERFDKAMAVGADRVVVDLEDAVPAADKAAAREALVAWLRPERQVVVRVNAADSAWFADDLALAALPGVFGVMLPKVDHVEAVDAVSTARDGLRVVPMNETAIGFDKVRAIARSRGVHRLAFGSIVSNSTSGSTATTTRCCSSGRSWYWNHDSPVSWRRSTASPRRSTMRIS